MCASKEKFNWWIVFADKECESLRVCWILLTSHCLGPCLSVWLSVAICQQNPDENFLLFCIKWNRGQVCLWWDSSCDMYTDKLLFWAILHILVYLMSAYEYNFICSSIHSIKHNIMGVSMNGLVDMDLLIRRYSYILQVFMVIHITAIQIIWKIVYGAKNKKTITLYN